MQNIKRLTVQQHFHSGIVAPHVVNHRDMPTLAAPYYDWSRDSTLTDGTIVCRAVVGSLRARGENCTNCDNCTPLHSLPFTMQRCVQSTTNFLSFDLYNNIYFKFLRTIDMWAGAPSVQCRKVWLTPTTRVPCSNAAKTRNPLKFAGVPQTRQQISAASGPKFTIL